MAEKRGGYAPNPANTPQPDSTLDAIQNHDVAFVPDLKLRAGQSAEDLTMVIVGTKTDDADAEVYMQPYYTAANDSTRIRFVFFDNLGKSRQINWTSINFADNLVSFTQTFDTESARSRWSTDTKRQAAYKDWLLFVWETRTGQTAPVEKSTAATKRKRETKIDQDESDAPNSKMPEMKLKGNDSVLQSQSEGNRPVKRMYEVWTSYNSGEFDIDNQKAVESARRAHRVLFKGDAHPSAEDLKAAFAERQERQITQCAMTTAWLQFQNRASGSSANAQVDTFNYAALAYGPITDKI